MAIVEALLAKDGAQAELLMKAHLSHITEHLDLERQLVAPADLVSLFGDTAPLLRARA
jgi:DNA-binding GntR family transcriptional regulator